MFKKILSLTLLLAISGAIAFAEEKAEPKKPFNGKNLDGWKAVNEKADNFWKTAKDAKLDPDNPRGLVPVDGEIDAKTGGVMLNQVGPDWKPQGVDFHSEEKYGDCTIDLEFMVSKGSNSGIYVMGVYEVQVLDSWGRADDKMNGGDVGALYGATPPKVNGSLEPGKWQRFIIEFTAPKFDKDGKKIQNAKFVKITLNGKVVQENVEMGGPTPGGVSNKEAAKGPLMFQGNHGPVAFRNIKIYEK